MQKTAIFTYNFNNEHAMLKGVYAIINTETGQSYIGSSLDIESRIQQHFFDLYNRRHSNWKMQRDYNNAKKKSIFKHRVLCSFNYIPRRYLYKLEQSYINRLDDGYNINKSSTGHLKEKETVWLLPYLWFMFMNNWGK